MTQQLDLFFDTPFNQYLQAAATGIAAGKVTLAYEALRQARHWQVSEQDERACAALTLLADLSADAQPLTRDPQHGWRRLQQELTPLAQRWLGPDAAGWLQQQGQRVALALELRPFHAAAGDIHAAAVWLHLDQPQRALHSVETDWLWRECPVRLHAHALAAEALDQHDPALLDWTLLALNFPEAAEQHLAHSRLLGDAWNAYSDLEPSVETRWFPLWCVLARRMAWPTPPLRLREPESQRAWDALTRAATTLPAARLEVGFRRWLRDFAPALQQAVLRQPG